MIKNAKKQSPCGWFGGLMLACLVGCKPQVPPVYAPTQRPVLSSIPSVSTLPDRAVGVGTIRDVRRLAEHPLGQEALQEVGLSPQAVRPKESLVLLAWDALKGSSSWLAQLPVVGKISLDALKMKQKSDLFASWQSFLIEGASFLGENAKSYVYDKKVRALLQALVEKAPAHDMEWVFDIEKLVASHEKEWMAQLEAPTPPNPALSSLLKTEDPLMRGLLLDPAEQKQREDQFSSELGIAMQRGFLERVKQWQRAQGTLDLLPSVWEAAVVVQHKPIEKPIPIESLRPAVDLTPFLPPAPIRGQINLQGSAGLYAVLQAIYAPALKENPVFQTWKALEETSQKQPQPVSVAFAYLSAPQYNQIGENGGFVIYAPQAGDMRQRVADVFAWLSSSAAQEAHKNMGITILNSFHASREIAHHKLHGWPVDRYESQEPGRSQVKRLQEVVQIGDYLFLSQGETLEQMVDAFFDKTKQRSSLLAMERFPAGGGLYVDVQIPDLMIALRQSGVPFLAGVLPLSATDGTLSAVHYQDNHGNSYTKLQIPRRLVEELGKGFSRESATLK